ncbi:MAG: hypothetical protein WKF92_04790 [Pyrinomonadaceae bacterium]
MRFIFAFFALTVVFSTSTAEARAQSLADNEHYRSFESWAVSTQFPNPLPNMFKFCIQSYEALIASGVSPSTRVRENSDRGILFKGTLQEIKEKWCDAGQKKVSGDVAAKHAPYKAALKADKLRLVIDETHGHVSSYALAGGGYTSDAKLLAAAKVWFIDIGPPSNEGQYCLNGGKRNSVRRYSFDAQHKLLGTTQKEYCGDPPASAYR